MKLLPLFSYFAKTYVAIDFFLVKKNLSRKGLIEIVNVNKQEVRTKQSLRKILEFICEFCKAKSTIINGNL